MGNRTTPTTLALLRAAALAAPADHDAACAVFNDHESGNGSRARCAWMPTAPDEAVLVLRGWPVLVATPYDVLRVAREASVPVLERAAALAHWRWPRLGRALRPDLTTLEPDHSQPTHLARRFGDASRTEFPVLVTGFGWEAYTLRGWSFIDVPATEPLRTGADIATRLLPVAPEPSWRAAIGLLERALRPPRRR